MQPGHDYMRRGDTWNRQERDDEINRTYHHNCSGNEVCVNTHSLIGGHHTAGVKKKYDEILPSTQYNQVSLKDLVMTGDLVFFLIHV